MLTYVLVDDSERIRKLVKEIINKIMFQKDIDYVIREFDGLNDELKTIIADKTPKIYILDIEFRTAISGLDIGKYIRSYDWDSELIYLTGHDKMFEKVFRSVYKVFDFIEKFDSMDKRLGADIRKIISKNWDKRKLTFANNRVNFQIYLDEINYIYRDTVERKLAIKTSGGNTFLIAKNFNDILTFLDERFRQVHRSCIVNTDKVHLYNWAQGYFILDNMERVDMLSKKFRFENE